MRKPSNVISINSGANAPLDPGPLGASGCPRKGKIINQHTRRQFVAAFFGLGYSTTQAARMTGHSRADGEEELRRIGYPAWERRTRGVAA